MQVLILLLVAELAAIHGEVSSVVTVHEWLTCFDLTLLVLWRLGTRVPTQHAAAEDDGEEASHASNE